MYGKISKYSNLQHGSIFSVALLGTKKLNDMHDILDPAWFTYKATERPPV